MSEHEAQAMLQACLDAYREGHYQTAVAQCRAAIERAPYLFEAYFYLSAGLSVLGRDEEALAVMQDAQRIHPDSAAVDYNLGELARQIGRYDEARRYYESALRKVSSDSALDDPTALRRRIEHKLSTLT